MYTRELLGAVWPKLMWRKMYFFERRAKLLSRLIYATNVISPDFKLRILNMSSISP
jgi:hypothetical protein